MVFGRKRIERPKNPLGYALYRYDTIVNTDLKGIISRIRAEKRINARKADVILEGAFHKLDLILDDISKDNLKVDYRSDKARDLIIEMIKRLKIFFEAAKGIGYEPEKLKNSKEKEELDFVFGRREEIRKKMKDIESDYL
ncbi:MAG: hypothetical protein H5T85_00555 [Actinobacteria bacterium]|nr:hypothetical protein [Actinomycetota bacterium]